MCIRDRVLVNCLHQIGGCETDLEQFNRQNGFRFPEGPASYTHLDVYKRQAY